MQHARRYDMPHTNLSAESLCSEPCVYGFCCELCMYGLLVSGESLEQLSICDNICGKSDVPYQFMYGAQHHA